MYKNQGVKTLLIFDPEFIDKNKLTGKFVVVDVPQYFIAARSYALAAFSSLSYPPVEGKREENQKKEEEAIL